MNRPYTFINVAMTADGKIDTFERKGAAISSKQDKQRVDELRAAADGILVGGKTLLEESPKLTVKSEALREDRVSRGLSPNPIKVGVVTVADVPLESDFIQMGETRVVILPRLKRPGTRLKPCARPAWTFLWMTRRALT